MSIILCLTISISGCIDTNSWQKKEGMIWHTVWHATYYGNPGLIDLAIDSLTKVEKSVSAFDPNSLISKINESEQGPVDFHLSTVYEMAREVNHRSGGMFDPTISKIINAWGFGKDHTPNSDTININHLLETVGIDKTYIQDGILHKQNKDISFNFSALAKGYGVDVAARVLRDNGCENLMVEIGGEIVCVGNNPEGKKWRILIETPDEQFLKEVFNSNSAPTFKDPLIVELDNEALATSGNYRNYRTSDGKAYGHTISPLTGRPVTTDILSASVIAPTCMEADAMATACMAMGSSDGMTMLNKSGLAGAFILNSGDVLVNDKMSKHIAISNQNKQ
ncbi:MAG: FAD:protein FMN transferase [Muribaculum sp.]|nr:FAD:protein FMN transferase [Muribaculum sp.]